MVWSPRGVAAVVDAAIAWTWERIVDGVGAAVSARASVAWVCCVSTGWHEVAPSLTTVWVWPLFYIHGAGGVRIKPPKKNIKRHTPQRGQRPSRHQWCSGRGAPCSRRANAESSNRSLSNSPLASRTSPHTTGRVWLRPPHEHNRNSKWSSNTSCVTPRGWHGGPLSHFPPRVRTGSPVPQARAPTRTSTARRVWTQRIVFLRVRCAAWDNAHPECGAVRVVAPASLRSDPDRLETTGSRRSSPPKRYPNVPVHTHVHVHVYIRLCVCPSVIHRRCSS